MERLIPKKFRGIFAKAKSSKGNRKAKIRAFCLECCGWQAKEVRDCTDIFCLFYENRLDHVGGGSTASRGKGVKQKEYNAWRKGILKRDEHKCRLCGKRKNLCVHHVVSVSEANDLIIEPNNGITLCDACHHQLHLNKSK